MLANDRGVRLNTYHYKVQGIGYAQAANLVYSLNKETINRREVIQPHFGRNFSSWVITSPGLLGNPLKLENVLRTTLLRVYWCGIKACWCCCCCCCKKEKR